MARDSKRGLFSVGSQHGDPFAEAAGDDSPVDIASVRRDDALIDAIASDGPVATDSADEYQLATLLANWRAEVIAPPLPAGPELDDIVAAVNQEIGARDARVSAGGRLRLVRPIAGAAAAIALVVGGMTAFSYNAQPGDPLWKVKQVVFSDQADSTVANNDSTSDLQQAEQLISAGNVTEAKAHLDRASQRTGDVSDSAKREQLKEWVSRLKSEVDKQLPQSSVPAPATTASGSTSIELPTTTAGLPLPTTLTWQGNPPPGNTHTVDPRTAALLPAPPADTSTVGEQPPVDLPTTLPPQTPDTTVLLAPHPTTEAPVQTTEAPVQPTQEPASTQAPPATKPAEIPAS